MTAEGRELGTRSSELQFSLLVDRFSTPEAARQQLIIIEQKNLLVD
jgi:hypothetical protein